MPEYRRFISYLYEYRKGRKAGNCGYVKVEVRNGICRLRLRLQMAGTSRSSLQVYGFVRKEKQILATLLGETVLKNSGQEFFISGPAAALGDAGYAIQDIRGIWLRGENDAHYITVWDDEPISPEQFATEQSPSAGQTDEAAEAETKDNPQAAEAKGQDNPQAAEAEAEDNPQAAEAEAEDEPQAMEAEEQDNSQAVEAEAEMKDNPQVGKFQPEADDLQAAQAKEASERKQTGSLWQRWGHFLNHYPQIQPFADEEIRQCIRIAPKDLSFLQPEEWQFGRNPFTRQAYMRYHHLMLGCHVKGRFVLAVPGSDDPQERYLARMCGFPYYKAADAQTPEDGVQAAGQREEGEACGYWYHFLNETCH